MLVDRHAYLAKLFTYLKSTSYNKVFLWSIIDEINYPFESIIRQEGMQSLRKRIMMYNHLLKSN